MDLQTLFYIIGIIFMVTVLAVLIIGAAVIYQIKKKINEVSKIASRPVETAAELGSGIIGAIISGISKHYRRQKR